MLPQAASQTVHHCCALFVLVQLHSKQQGISILPCILLQLQAAGHLCPVSRYPLAASQIAHTSYSHPLSIAYRLGIAGCTVNCIKRWELCQHQTGVLSEPWTHKRPAQHSKFALYMEAPGCMAYTKPLSIGSVSSSCRRIKWR